MEQFNFKKNYGQNFLRNIVEIIRFCDIADIDPKDQILEIGPGDGAVTEEILNRQAKVTAIEIDPELNLYLQAKFKGNENFQVINQDILILDLNTLKLDKGFKVVSALPYNIAKKIVFKFLTSKMKAASLTFIMQKEVAEDYAAFKQGQRKFLNIWAQTYCDEIIYHGDIATQAFFPEPKVKGGIITFRKLKNPFLGSDKFLRFVRAGFSAPRKILSTNLHNIGFEKTKTEKILSNMKLNPKSRAGELDFNNWLKLYKNAVK